MSSPSKSPTMEHVQESHPHLKASVSQVNTYASTGSPSPKQQQQVQHEAADRNTEASLTTRTKDAIVAPTEVDQQLLDEEEELNNFNNNLERQQQDAFLRSFPPGYRFNPRDDELVQYYLQKKILKEPLPPNKIMEVNLYRHNPETLAERYESYGEKEWYFFTPRDRKYPNGQRPNRKAGDGYWKATGADRPIKSGKLQVGCRKALVFYRGKPPKGTKTNWIMHEYRVSDSPTTETTTKRTHKGMRLDDWVLCRIYKKAASKNNKAQSSIHEPVYVEESLSTSLPNDIEMEMNDQVDNTQAPESEGEHPHNIVHQSYGYTYPAYSSRQSMFPALDDNNMFYDHQRFKPVPLSSRESYANMLHTCGSSSRISYPDQSYSQQFTNQKRGVQFDDQRFIVHPVDITSESMICTGEVSDQKCVVQIPNQKFIMQSVNDITSGSMFCPDQKSIKQEIGKSLLPPPSGQGQQYIEESDDDVHNFFVDDPPFLPLGSLWP